MINSLSIIEEDTWKASERSEWPPLLHNLSILHNSIKQRVNHGTVGLCKPSAFNTSSVLFLVRSVPLSVGLISKNRSYYFIIFFRVHMMLWTRYCTACYSQSLESIWSLRDYGKYKIWISEERNSLYSVPQFLSDNEYILPCRESRTNISTCRGVIVQNFAKWLWWTKYLFHELKNRQKEAGNCSVCFSNITQ